MATLIFKNLFRRKTRTLLTLAGITVGVALIVALGTVAEVMRTGYMSMFSGSGADLVLMQRGAYDITLSAVDEDVIAQVMAMPEVSAATGIVIGNITAPNLPSFYMFGYAPNGFAIKRFKIVEGQALDVVRQAGSNREILMGKKLAEAMKLKIGDGVRLTGGAFRVVGIYETGSAWEDAAMVLPLADAQQLVQKKHQVCAVQVKLKDVQQIDRVRAQLEGMYSRLIVSQSSQVANQQQIIGVVQGLGLGIALLAVVIGGVGMMNTVMMGAFERTREIGTLRALGWGRRRVMLMVLGESIGLGALGGLVGCAAGAAIIGLMAQSPDLSHYSGRLTLPLLGQGMLTAILLGSVGGAYPAWWASRLLPVEAMRYEGGVSNAQSQIPNLPFGIGCRRLEIGRTLWRRRTRTALTVVGVSIGLAAVVIMGGLMDGMVTAFTQAYSAGGMDLFVRQRDVTDQAFSVMNEQVGRQIAALPGVQSIGGMITGIQSSEEIPYLLVMGQDLQGPVIRHYKIVEGRRLLGSRELILGRPAADAIKAHVGSVVRLGEASYRVVGLFETGTSWEESIGDISLRDAQTLYGKPHQVTYYTVKVREPQQAKAIATQIEASFPDLTVSLTSELAESLPDFQKMDVLRWAIGALVIIVGGIGMMNTLFMSVFERTREIGTLRALGWRRLRVLTTVLEESLALSLIGAAVGVALSVVISALLRQIPMFGGMLVIVFSAGLLIRALMMAIGLGAVGGLYPAWRAANLQPVEALRYE